jgi:predicted nucleic acid-binding protein
MGATLLRLLDRGDTLAPSCVNLADFEAGLCQCELLKAEAVLGQLRFLVTTPEAAQRAGRYQAGWARQRRRVETRTPSLPEPPGPMAPCS